jgi:GT2 family glycosyltransferase
MSLPKNTHSGLSVIICTYNTLDLTCKCINALQTSINNFSFPVEIIVVENGTDGTGEKIKNDYPRIKVIEPGENTGFTRGNNLGMKLADKHSGYFLLLNSDAIVRKDTLEKAMGYLDSHPDCDVLGCRLEYQNGSMQPSAGYLPQPINTAMWMLGLDRIPLLKKISKPVHPKSADFFSKDRRVEWVMGAFMLLKREVYDQTGGFDEKFFMYMEEVEWSKRINEAGFKIVYTPSFQITHLDKASVNFDLNQPLTKEIQGLKYLIKKYYPGSMFFLNLVIFLGIIGRWLGLTLKGDKIRANIYRQMLNKL